MAKHGRPRNYNNFNNQQSNEGINLADMLGSVDESVRIHEPNISTEDKSKTIDSSTENTDITLGNTTPTVPDNTTVKTDQDGVTVAKPITDTSIQFVQPTTQNNTSENDKDALRMEELINQYKNFNTGTIMKSAKDQRTAGNLFREMLFFAADHPTKEVLDCVYRFFKQNRDKILAPQLVLPPTLKMSRNVAERIHCLYTLFRGLTEDKVFRLNIATTREMLHMPDTTKVDALLMYFDVKQRS